MAGMTFPLGSLSADGAVAARTPAMAATAPRWRQQLMLVAGAVLWLLFVLAMVTHSAADPAFSTSGSGDALRNKAGLVGAWVSDLVYFLFGFSAWWLVPVGLRSWLAALALRLRGEDEAHAPAWPRTVFWCGLALLMASSATLEWTR